MMWRDQMCPQVGHSHVHCVGSWPAAAVTLQRAKHPQPILFPFPSPSPRISFVAAPSAHASSSYRSGSCPLVLYTLRRTTSVHCMLPAYIPESRIKTNHIADDLAWTFFLALNTRVSLVNITQSVLTTIQPYRMFSPSSTRS